jgi:branched-chain amino acid transport system ATP-binding protein
VLALRDIRASYGKVAVLHGIDLDVAAGSIVALLGANGAGKTTTLKVIAGLLPGSGRIRFEGRALDGQRPDRVVRLGISLVPETRELFLEMTVAENLRLGAFARADRRTIGDDLELNFALFPRLRERYRQIAGTLSGGEQQMLTIARALMARPKLLLLDEPSLGLAPNLVEEIFATVARIRRAGLGILLVEQNARMALAIADSGYVLEAGEIRLHGRASDLESNPEVQRAYLRT